MGWLEPSNGVPQNSKDDILRSSVSLSSSDGIWLEPLDHLNTFDNILFMKNKTTLTKEEEIELLDFLYEDFLNNREEYDLLKLQLDELNKYLEARVF